MGKEHLLTLEEAILETLKDLDPARQQEILDYARRLRIESNGPKKPRKSLAGAWADLGTNLSEEDIREVRSEMWKGFPRDFPGDDS
jgi:hypothetical protein